MKGILITGAIVVALLQGCGDQPPNNPYPPEQQGKNIRYSVFSERPKTLDPARSYSSAESVFNAQIYEPPLQYHFLKRPYTLIPLTAAELPTVTYYDKHGHALPEGIAAEKIHRSVYRVRIKPKIYYQDHPAFVAKNRQQVLKRLSDYGQRSNRELHAQDYVYQIKRLADPRLNSPIFGLMSGHLHDLKAYRQRLVEAIKADPKKRQYLDLRQYPMAGTKVIDDYTYEITLDGRYAQFMYWLAMPFFAPVPWEADAFYSQPGMKENNLSFDWQPVGTGPYQLTMNNPNRRMELSRNPHFHEEYFPSQGEPGDEVAGYLVDKGKRLPFVDKQIFMLEKENIPYWNKFLQGYYDQSGLSSDSFDQAISFGESGAKLTPAMLAKGIRLQTTVDASIYYLGFNMLDPVVGGNSERARKLRQAISIALDYEEYVAIFQNGRGMAAQGPIPPGIAGYKTGKAGINPVIYDWHHQRAQRKPIQDAKKLLAEAGYPDGIDSRTGKPLVLYYDITAGSGPDDKARLAWMRKQFKKIGLQLFIRSTQYNRFQKKMHHGNAQIFSWGWLADYPDPENFLFLLYGKNGMVKHAGENAANYTNPHYDALFEKMKNMPNGPERQKVIDEMVKIIREDAPWAWGFHPSTFGLMHQWNRLSKPNVMSQNTLKYARIDPQLREQKRREWNTPVTWPIWLALGIVAVASVPVYRHYRRRENRTIQRRT